MYVPTGTHSRRDLSLCLKIDTQERDKDALKHVRSWALKLHRQRKRKQVDEKEGMGNPF
jgi:hypothetical protein